MSYNESRGKLYRLNTQVILLLFEYFVIFLYLASVGANIVEAPSLASPLLSTKGVEKKPLKIKKKYFKPPFKKYERKPYLQILRYLPTKFQTKPCSNLGLQRTLEFNPNASIFGGMYYLKNKRKRFFEVFDIPSDQLKKYLAGGYRKNELWKLNGSLVNWKSEYEIGKDLL